MLTNRQIFFNNVSTIGATLRCSIWINFNYFLCFSFYRFKLQNRNEVRPRTISNMFSKIAVLHHIFNIQIFNKNSVIFFKQIISSFKVKIFSFVRYFFVCFSNEYSELVSVIRTFLSTRKSLLSLSKAQFCFLKESWVLNDFIAGCYSKRSNSQINPTNNISFRKWFNWNFITGKDNKPLAGRSFLNICSFNYAFNWSMKFNVNRTNFANNKFFINNLTTRGILREANRIKAILPFETRESGFLFLFNSTKEILKSSIKSFKNLLEILRKYFFIFRERFFEFFKLISLMIIIKRFFINRFISVYSLFKSSVIEITTKIKLIIKNYLNRLRRVNPILKTFSHCTTKLSKYLLKNKKHSLTNKNGFEYSMKFLDGYIIATIMTGILSLIDYSNEWRIDTIWIILPVIFYLILSIIIVTVKTIIKMKG